jgi:peptidoglycan-associated lipoprotein
MMTCQAALVLAMLVMAVTFGGCAAPSANQDPSAIASVDRTSMAARDMDASGVRSSAGTRPRIADFVAQDELNHIYFDFDSYEIRPVDTKALTRSVQWLKAHPDALLLIEGHADERGTNEYNVALGERRAAASMHYLVSHGIAATRITVVSYGEERSLCREKAERCWSKNRRAHFLVKSR